MHAHAGDAAHLLKALGNEQRLLILCNLLARPLSVGELNERLELSQSALSQHLALLREGGLVDTRREAQSIFYSLPPGPVTRIMALLQDIYCSVPPAPEDRKPAPRPARDDHVAANRWPGQLTLLAAFLGALAIGLSLGLLGSGGSILTVPVLHYLLQQPEQVAIGGSLLVVGLIAAAACLPYAVARQVDWRNVLWFGLPGMLGAWLGASLARWVPGPAQLALFAVVMLVAAWRMLRSTPVATGDHKPHPLAIVAGGTAVGALSGLVGVGGGFLIVPALVLLAGVPMTSAVGTSLAVIAMNSFTGFGKYLQVLEAKGVALDWRTLLLIAAIGVVGSFAGNRLGRRLPQSSLRRLFGLFLVVMGIFVAADAGPRLLH
jgi:hypothetical protein